MTPARFFGNSPPSTLAALLGLVTPGSTGTIQVADNTSWPSQFPFTVLIDWGLGTFEVATITQAATGTGPFTYANCIRGADGSLAPAHSSGAVIVPGTSARDFNDAAVHVNSFPQGMAPAGLAGATAASRYVGATSSGAPVSGTFIAGDFVIDRAVAIWVCTAGGTPGTWASLTAAVSAAVTAETARAEAAEAALAPLASPALTGTPTAPTKTALTASTALATTAYADAAVAVETSRAEAAEAAALLKAGGTMTGRLTPAVFPLTDAATITVDASLGNIATVTLGGSRTIGAPSNPVNGQPLEFWLTQDGTGSRLVTWNAVYSFGGGSAPALSTAAGSLDRVGFRYSSAKSQWLYNGSLAGF